MSLLRDSPTDKLRGGYYTPRAVAEWLAKWAIRSKHDVVLEPSCGAGIFIMAAATQLGARRNGRKKDGAQIVGVELLPEEAEKARNVTRGVAEIVGGDFFERLEQFQLNSFDVILGNPPFIRYQNFPEPSRTLAMRFMQTQGLLPNRLTNIWVPFIVAGTALLREGGRLAMVVPAELLQVSYAAQLRQYLVDSFQRITVFACNEMFFKGAEQEVVLLAAEGKLARTDSRNPCEIALIQASCVAELLNKPPETRRAKGPPKFVRHDTEKWLKYFLDAREIEFMRSLREHPLVGTLADHAAIDVGVVTGRNEFFLLGRERVASLNLHEFVVPVVGRSAHLPGAVFRKRDHHKLGDAGKNVYLLHVCGLDEWRFTPELRGLIREGERQGCHRGYKCRIRNPWYYVPGVWGPDCFVFRQIYDFPRVVVNRAKATSTDTIHRMRCRAPASRVAANLYTHLTAASAEIEGRSYGGGVLELEPTEAERLLLPKHLDGALPIDAVDKCVRQGRLADVLHENDRFVLRAGLGLTSAECTLLKRVWVKMRDRRLARRRR